jgi:hypothetical protein
MFFLQFVLSDQTRYLVHINVNNILEYIYQLHRGDFNYKFIKFKSPHWIIVAYGDVAIGQCEPRNVMLDCRCDNYVR